jgi:hypothetical protein
MLSALQLLEILLNGVTIGVVYVLVAAGLSVVFGVMDVSAACTPGSCGSPAWCVSRVA